LKIASNIRKLAPIVDEAVVARVAAVPYQPFIYFSF
jgi:hypothetical protein